jgi:pimeloyl-ACP methyl ester carboxylesterase
VPANYAVEGGGLLSRQPSAYESASGDYVSATEDMPDLIARYSTLTLPIGILYGSDDRVLNARANGSAMQTLIPGLDYEEIKGAGHMIPLTRPGETATFIRRMAAKL